MLDYREEIEICEMHRREMFANGLDSIVYSHCEALVYHQAESQSDESQKATKTKSNMTIIRIQHSRQTPRQSTYESTNEKSGRQQHITKESLGNNSGSEKRSTGQERRINEPEIEYSKAVLSSWSDGRGRLLLLSLIDVDILIDVDGVLRILDLDELLHDNSLNLLATSRSLSNESATSRKSRKENSNETAYTFSVNKHHFSRLRVILDNLFRRGNLRSLAVSRGLLLLVYTVDGLLDVDAVLVLRPDDDDSLLDDKSLNSRAIRLRHKRVNIAIEQGKEGNAHQSVFARSVRGHLRLLILVHDSVLVHDHGAFGINNGRFLLDYGFLNSSRFEGRRLQRCVSTMRVM